MLFYTAAYYTNYFCICMFSPNLGTPCMRRFCLILAMHTHAVLVSMSAGANPTLGQSYTLTCNVSVSSGSGIPTVQWVGPGSSAPIATGGDFIVSSTPPYTLIINPLRPPHAGQYTCQATVGGDTGTASVMVENIPGMHDYILYKNMQGKTHLE